MRLNPDDQQVYLQHISKAELAYSNLKVMFVSLVSLDHSSANLSSHDTILPSKS